MASISHKEVEYVAQLARLDLTEPEKTLFGEQLSQILTFVGQLQEVSTEGIPPHSFCGGSRICASTRSSSRGVIPRASLKQCSRIA